MHNIIYDFLGLNKEIFLFINKTTNFGVIPYVLQIISKFFFIGNFAVYYFIICLYCYFKLKKLPDPKIKFIPIYNNLVKAGTCYTLFGFTYAALKFGINLPRPFCSLLPTEFMTIIDTQTQRCFSSFPSAHTGLAIIIAYYLWPHLKKSQQIMMSLLIIILAISRMTLAMHYPADIIYGGFIAYSLIILSNNLVDALEIKIMQSIRDFVYMLLFNK